MILGICRRYAEKNKEQRRCWDRPTLLAEHNFPLGFSDLRGRMNATPCSHSSGSPIAPIFYSPLHLNNVLALKTTTALLQMTRSSLAMTMRSLPSASRSTNTSDEFTGVSLKKLKMADHSTILLVPSSMNVSDVCPVAQLGKFGGRQLRGGRAGIDFLRIPATRDPRLQLSSRFSDPPVDVVLNPERVSHPVWRPSPSDNYLDTDRRYKSLPMCSERTTQKNLQGGN